MDVAAGTVRVAVDHERAIRGAEEGRDRLVVTLEYSTDLFEASTVERLAGHYVRLLEGAAAEPERRTPWERRIASARKAT